MAPTALFPDNQCATHENPNIKKAVSMGNLIGKLLIDEWYKMIAFGGFVLVVLSLTIKLQVDNPLALAIGSALLFSGVAEMAMRPYQEQIGMDSYNRPTFRVAGRMRRVNTSGIVLYTLAVICAAGALVRVWVLIGQA